MNTHIEKSILTSEQRIPGKGFLEKTYSLEPFYLRIKKDDLNEMNNSQIKDLHLQIVDDYRKKGRDISHREIVMQEYLLGSGPENENDKSTQDIDEVKYLENCRAWITEQIEHEKDAYDQITGLAFYDHKIRARIIQNIKARELRGEETPNIYVILSDVNMLKKLNTDYGKVEANKVLEIIGESLKRGIEDTEFSSTTNIYAGRMRATGDEMIVVIIGDEIGAKELLKKYDNSPEPTTYLRNVTLNRMKEVKASFRSCGISSSNYSDTEADILDKMIIQAEREVDKLGHERKNV